MSDRFRRFFWCLQNQCICNEIIPTLCTRAAIWWIKYSESLPSYQLPPYRNHFLHPQLQGRPVFPDTVVPEPLIPEEAPPVSKTWKDPLSPPFHSKSAHWSVNSVRNKWDFFLIPEHRFIDIYLEQAYKSENASCASFAHEDNLVHSNFKPRLHLQRCAPP